MNTSSPVTEPKRPTHLKVLGSPLGLLGPDGKPYSIENQKHLALLARLVLDPGTYSREQLKALVWDSSGAAQSVEGALSFFRTVYNKFDEKAFPWAPHPIHFDPALVRCDAVELLDLAERGGADSWREAMNLYRGPFLEGLKTAGLTAKFIQWIEDTRLKLEVNFINICQRSCQSAAAVERWSDVREIAREAEKRVSNWEGARRWLSRAELEITPPPEIAPPIPPPVTAQKAEGNRSHRTLLILGLVLGGMLLFGGMLWVATRSRADQQAVAAGVVENPPECKVGAAVANLVDEVFFYGTAVRPGGPFAKRWTLQNVGDCTWGTRFRLQYDSSSGPRLSSTRMDRPLARAVPPGDTVTFDISMLAPEESGIYDEFWHLRDGSGHAVPIGNRMGVVTRVVVPRRSYPPCGPGDGSATLLQKKYVDGTVVPAGTQVRYSWTLKNTGECVWRRDAALRYISNVNGRLSSIDSVRVTRSVSPFQTYTFLVPVRVPGEENVYQETWELRGGAGTVIPVNTLPSIGMQIRVLAPNAPLIMPLLCRAGTAKVRFLDENWPDSSIMAPRQEFQKRWTVVNDGDCGWRADYRLEFMSMRNRPLARSTEPKPLGEIVPPGAAYTFEVPMRAPTWDPNRSNIHREDWRFVDDDDQNIMIGTSPNFAVIIVVEP
jgi:Ig-like domain from next to BRCA1 gene